MDHLTAICLAAFLTGSTADTVTTGLAVKAGAAEQNSTARGWALPVSKAAGAGLMTGWALKTSPDHKRLVRGVLVAGAAFYAGLAWHNYGVYRQQQIR